MRKYWLLARMCNDVIVHATRSGFFIYISPQYKVMLGYPPSGLSEAQMLKTVHPDDLRAMKALCNEPMPSPARTAPTRCDAPPAQSTRWRPT